MHAANVRDRWKVISEYKMDEKKLFQLFKLVIFCNNLRKYGNHPKHHSSVSLTYVCFCF